MLSKTFTWDNLKQEIHVNVEKIEMHPVNVMVLPGNNYLIID